MKTSIVPVGKLGLTAEASRSFTSPSMRMTHSARTFSAAAKAGESGSITAWVTP
ncbi:hypothetical protein D3C86_2182200 [compost metagenome]